MLVVEIFLETIHKIYKDDDPIRYINSTDTIYVYQLPCPSTEQDGPNWVVFPVYCSTTLNHISLSSIPQFGLPIVLAIETEKLNDASNLYYTIVKHIERYCMLKLFEEDNSSSSSPIVPDTADVNSTLYVQQPIHTIAAVTPAGGRSMVPMPNLFNIYVFDVENSFDSSTFPGSEIQLYNADEPLKQGRGILIEWSTSKAQQFFGTNTLNNEINTEAWFDYDHEKSNNSRYSRTSNKSSGLITLDDCLDEFTGDEQLDDQDSWYCPRCKKHQRALKKMDIWKLPEVMVIHLKRFSQVRRWGNKVDTMIDFPLKSLDMTNRVLGHQNESLIYDLYAVDNHYGGINGGHCKQYTFFFFLLVFLNILTCW